LFGRVMRIMAMKSVGQMENLDKFVKLPLAEINNLKTFLSYETIRYTRFDYK
jgi:hypothetical protein